MAIATMMLEMEAVCGWRYQYTVTVTFAVFSLLFFLQRFHSLFRLLLNRMNTSNIVKSKRSAWKPGLLLLSVGQTAGANHNCIREKKVPQHYQLQHSLESRQTIAWCYLDSHHIHWWFVDAHIHALAVFVKRMSCVLYVSYFVLFIFK